MVAAAGDKPAELFLYNEISGFGTTAELFRQSLDSTADRPLTVRINSYGGEVVDAVAIYNLLRNRPNVITQVDGLAASAASVIAMAGKTRRMASNSWLMIHNPIVAAFGDERKMRSAAEALTAMKSSLVGTYAQRTGRTSQEVAAMMDAETWFTAEQAKAAGFTDEITEPFAAEASLRFGAEAFGKFSKVPEAVLAAWGLPPQQTNNDIMSKLTEFLDSFKAGPSERETFLASLVKDAGLDPDEAFKAKDQTALTKVVEAALRSTVAESKAQDERIQAALKTAGIELPIAKIEELKATIDARIETEASRKMAGMSAARGIKAVKTDPQDTQSNKPQSLREKSIAWRKEHGLPVPA